ncbi:MAG: hypothetical protein QM496_11600 [Verrucomicrobiota bacterium]
MSKEKSSAPNSESGAASPVRQRRVFYFSGFDPRGPAPYHALYLEEGKKQAALNGLDLSVKKRSRKNRLSSVWEISAVSPGNVRIETTYEFLRWDDIIRRNWPKNEMTMFLRALKAYWVFLSSGLIGKFLHTSWPPSLTLIYPLLYIIAVLIGGAGISVAAAVGMVHFFSLSWWVALISSLATVAGFIAIGRILDQRFHAYWLLRTYTFMLKWATGGAPELSQRIEDFAQYIADYIAEGEDDEVLIVSHSVGTILVIPLVAKLLKQNRETGKGRCRLGLVTLGNSIPLVSYLSGARAFREDLKEVAFAAEIDWVDFSARRDGACFARADPVTSSGIERPPDCPIRPVMLPARFVQMFSESSYNQIKRDIFRIHFQYLMAGEKLTKYDFFAISAGPQTLSERYIEHTSSISH